MLSYTHRKGWRSGFCMPFITRPLERWLTNVAKGHTEKQDGPQIGEKSPTPNPIGCLSWWIPFGKMINKIWLKLEFF